MTEKRKLPTVGECIAYIQETGWKLTVRRRSWYVFRNEGAELHIRELVWTLAELRDTWRNGF
jgi:hypothetical protein